MDMAYRERWMAEIAAMRRLLSGFAMNEECKWGKPTYTVDRKNVVIMQGFKEYFALGFFQGALLKDPKRVLAQLGKVHAGRVMKFTSVKEIVAQTATIKAYVREAIAVEKAGRRRGYLYHFAAAKQSATRVARIEKMMPAIFAGRGFLEQR